LRSVSAAVEEKDSELNYVMQSFKLDFLNPSEDPNQLPEVRMEFLSPLLRYLDAQVHGILSRQELIEKCAVFQTQSNRIEDLETSLEQLNLAHQDIDNVMKDMLDKIEVIYVSQGLRCVRVRLLVTPNTFWFLEGRKCRRRVSDYNEQHISTSIDRFDDLQMSG
jgi:hypothetical protein